jgi:hypothetical protein
MRDDWRTRAGPVGRLLTRSRRVRGCNKTTVDVPMSVFVLHPVQSIAILNQIGSLAISPSAVICLLHESGVRTHPQ